MPTEDVFEGLAQNLLADLTDAIAKAADFETVAADVVARCVEILGADAGKLLQLQSDDEELHLVSGKGWLPGLVNVVTVETGWDSQAGYALMHPAEPVVVTDLVSESRFRRPSLLHAHGIRSGLSAVVPGHGEPFGVLGVHWKHARTFTHDEVRFVAALASGLGVLYSLQSVAAPALTWQSERYAAGLACGAGT